MAKRSKPSSDNEEYSPTKRAKSSVPHYLTRHSTRRTARTRSQSNQPPYVRDPNNSDDSDGLVTTAPGGKNNSRRVRKDHWMSGALTEGAIKWNSTMRKGYSREANKEEYERQRTEAMKKLGMSLNADGELQGHSDLERAMLEAGDVVTTESGETGTTESGETSTTASGETGTEENDVTPAEGAPEGDPHDPIEDAQHNQALSSLSSSQTQDPVKTLEKRATPDQEEPGQQNVSSASSKSSKRQKTTKQQVPRKLSDVVEETKESSLPLYSDDSNDFKPDDESTPFNKFTNNAATQSTIPSSDTPDFGFRKRVRKSKIKGSNPQNSKSPNAIFEEPPRSSPPELDQALAPEDENESDASEPELPPHPPARAQRELTPPELPEWMAPPASSSSPIKSPKVKPKKLAVGLDKKKPKNLSTKDLQSMLPKRRAQSRETKTDEFDIPDDDSDVSAEEVSDDDELSVLPKKKPTRSRSRAATRSESAPVTDKSRSQIGKTPKQKPLLDALTDAKKPKATKKNSAPPKSKPKAKTPTTFAKPSRTTPLKTSTTVDTTSDRLDRPPSASSNKENRTKPLISSPLSTTPSTASEPMDSIESGTPALPLPIPKGVAKTKEIKGLAKKFNDVDEWSLDFEDNSMANSSDQGKR